MRYHFKEILLKRHLNKKRKIMKKRKIPIRMKAKNMKKRKVKTLRLILIIINHHLLSK